MSKLNTFSLEELQNDYIIYQSGKQNNQLEALQSQRLNLKFLRRVNISGI